MPQDSKGLQPGMAIPDFSLQDVNGTTYSSVQFKGQPWLLYFMRGTW